MTNFILLIIFAALLYWSDFTSGGFWSGRVFPLAALGLYFYLLLVAYDLFVFRRRVPRRDWQAEEDDDDASPSPESPADSARDNFNPPDDDADFIDDLESQKKSGWWRRR